MIKLAEKYINANKYFPNSDELNEYYLSHPNYPSLYAVIDTLNFFKVENLAIKVSAEEFDNLPKTFLTFFQNDFVLITKNDNSHVNYLDENNKYKTLTRKQFLLNWQGIIIIVETNENIQEQKKDYKFQWYVVFVWAICLILASSIFRYFNWVQAIYSFLSLSGLYLSILIIQENLRLSNKITSKVCNSQFERVNCSSILNSEGAKIYKNYTLSDCSLVFFSTTSLLSLFNFFSNAYFVPICVMFIPIIIYSIVYQGVKVKKWCPLCLGIIGVLCLFIMVTVKTFSSFFMREIMFSFIYFTISFILILNIWICIKPLISGYFKLKESERENKRFKRNFNTFKYILNTSKKVDFKELRGLKKIEFGNIDSNIELKLFLSPSCKHCYQVFEESNQLLQKFYNQIKLTIYFNVNIENHYNKYGIVCALITEIYFSDGKEKALELLVDWYINKLKINNFIQKYNTTVSFQAREIILSHFNWCKDNDLNYSPVKIFQNHVVPNEYSIEDLAYFIHDRETCEKILLL